MMNEYDENIIKIRKILNISTHISTFNLDNLIHINVTSEINHNSYIYIYICIHFSIDTHSWGYV